MTAVHKLRVGEATIEYTIRRSRRRRKTVEISVSRGAVVVSAPMRTPNKEIQEIVRKRHGWILGKLEVPYQEPPSLKLVTGETLPFMGQDLTLAVEDAAIRRSTAQLDGGQLLLRVPEGLPEEQREEWALAAVIAWYKDQTARFVSDSVSRWLPVMGRSETPRVLVRSQKTRWGSCSSDGALRFSWRLAMVEPDLIDSVVVHELAHLEVMNHSSAFWDVVLRAMPDARQRRKRLDEAGRRLPL